MMRKSFIFYAFIVHMHTLCVCDLCLEEHLRCVFL